MKDSDVIEFLQKLVQTQSYSGQEDKIAGFIKDAMYRTGFDVVDIDKYGSVIGRIKGSKPGRTVLIDAHIDTVPVVDEEKWKYPPFKAEIADGKMYGRGTSDMKGGLAAALFGIANFAKNTKKNFSGEVCLSCTVEEECFEGISSRLVSDYVNPDFVIIAEATECNVNIGQRGRAEIVIETEGISCHSSNPEKGVNAVYSMLKVIEEVRKINLSHHRILGDAILCLTDIQSVPYPGASVVPSLCRATFDRRLLVGETESLVIRQINQAIESVSSKDSTVKARAYITEGKAQCYTGETLKAKRFFPAWCYREDEPIINRIVQNLNDTGLDAKLSHYSFCTNGSHFCGENGILGIGYGPSREDLAHTRDEYIEISELLKAEKGYECILNSLLV